MEEIANAMAERRIDATLCDRELTLSQEQDYAESDFKFNPDSIVGSRRAHQPLRATHSHRHRK